MKCAPDLPARDVDSLTSMERFVFLHTIVNSAMTFLSTEGVKRKEDNFVQLLLQAQREWVENAGPAPAKCVGAGIVLWGHHGNDVQADEHQKNLRQSLSHSYSQ